MSLVIVGTFNLDTIETPQERRERIVGGSGTYCCLAASFFTSPGIVGVVGEDFPKETLELFKTKGIDAEGLLIRQGKTFFWEGRYEDDPNKRTTVATEVNVLKGFRPQIPEGYRDADILFLANIDPDLQEDILAQVKNPRLVAMDSMNYWIQTRSESLLKVLEKVDVFFANDEEVRMLTDELNLVTAGKRLLEKGPKLVVIKKGEHGALLLSQDFVFVVPAYPSEAVVDPTGAGDSFGGGFLGYLDKTNSYDETDIRKAAVYGSVMASFTIEKFGIDRLVSLSSDEIEVRLAEFHKLVSF
jgi:sugar/nucleoside kinase (ribokinase family)